ncbi:hypothetical protein [Paracidobacterium acidisoli]|uniref:Uncharacterized protein n=1 Tax=Paracidobacterium acidisoli TaxID=2303751 RepID=A0A372IJ82_9BACT|nr:hypothetical protein [Paracidobacterium acidisoli]MBT9333144.1 hypothetical protein [Paracidobacterium acidisoli]
MRWLPVFAIAALALGSTAQAQRATKLTVAPDNKGHQWTLSATLRGNPPQGKGQAKLTIDGNDSSPTGDRVQYTIDKKHFTADILFKQIPKYPAITRATLCSFASSEPIGYRIDIHLGADAETADNAAAASQPDTCAPENAAASAAAPIESASGTTPSGTTTPSATTSAAPGSAAPGSTASGSAAPASSTSASSTPAPAAMNNGGESSTQFDWLIHTTSPLWVTLLLVLAVIGLFAWTAISSDRYRRAQRNIPSEGWVADIVNQQLRLQRQTPLAAPGDTKADNALRQAGDALHTSQALLPRLKELEEQAPAVKTIEANLGLLKNEWALVSGRLREWKQRETRPAPPPLQTRIPREAAVLVAVINRWMEQQTGERAQLEQIAAQVELLVMPAVHGDLNRVFRDLTTFEYPFEFAADGPWLLAAIPGTGDYWAAPVDARSFSMGYAPQLLDRLFLGFENARTGFQFETIYRPCRLRPVPGGPELYKVVERGLIRLTNTAAPTEPPPVAYEAFLPRSSSSGSGNGFSGTSGSMLAEWIFQTCKQLDSHVEQLGRLEEDLKGLETDQKQVIRNVVSQLQSQMDQQFAALRQKLQSLEQALESRQPEPARSLTESVPVEAAAVRPVSTDLPAAISHLASDVSSQQAVAGERTGAPPAASTVTDAVTASAETASPAARILSSPVSPAAPPSTSRTTVPAQNRAPSGDESAVSGTSGEFRMPDKWQQAVARAAAGTSSEPAVSGMPSPELYVMRTRNLATALAALKSRPAAAVVHVKKYKVEGQFEVHEVNTDTDGRTSCVNCGEGVPWQLAVRVGAPDAAQIFLLFPLGMLGKGHYAAGYSAIIDEALPSSFCIAGISEPAILRRTDEPSRTYSVFRRMSLSAPAEG